MVLRCLSNFSPMRTQGLGLLVLGSMTFCSQFGGLIFIVRGDAFRDEASGHGE